RPSRPVPMAVTTPPGYPDPDSNRHALGGFNDYEVVYDDPQGNPMLAFADGQWFDVTSLSPRPVSVRHALRRDPAWSGAVVQTLCPWMRSNPNHERSFGLATELALAVGELARQRRSQASWLRERFLTPPASVHGLRGNHLPFPDRRGRFARPPRAGRAR